MTHNEVMYEKSKALIEDGTGCKLLSKKYIHNNEELTILCKCGSIFNSTYKYFQTVRLKMCEKCRIKQKSEELHKRFVRRVFELVSDEYEVLTHYNGSKKHVLMKHSSCGYEWNVMPANFISGGTRCPKCAGYMKSNTKEFKAKLYKMYGGEYEVLGEYARSDVKIKILHNKCGKANMITPNDVLSGNKCHHCSGLKRKTLQEIQEEVFDMVGSEYTVNGIYKNNKSPLTFTHSKCQGSFKMNANNFLSSKQRCPICAMSKGEQVIYKYLTNNNIKFTPQKFYPELRGLNDGSLSYDFYLPKYKILIEFQGRQHESYIEGLHESEESFKIQQEHDRRKREYAKRCNKKLLEIWYYDFDNIESILDQELNLNNYKTQQLQLEISQ